MSDRLPRTENRAYDLRQRLNRAMRWLREAEDIARIEMPAWPTAADRIRDIYEQLTDDVLNGRTDRPPHIAETALAEERAKVVEEIAAFINAVGRTYTCSDDLRRAIAREFGAPDTTKEDSHDE